MKSHYARSYPESKQIREQLWLQNTERLEIRALHSGLGLYSERSSLPQGEESQSKGFASIQLPSVSLDMLQDSTTNDDSKKYEEENLSNLIASMRSTSSRFQDELSSEKIKYKPQSLPVLPRETYTFSRELFEYMFRFKKIILLHLADFILVMSIVSMCFMLAVIGYKISQPDVAFHDLSKWEPIKFLLERNWYEVLFAFYGMFFIYWVTFKALRINTFGYFLVNDINQKQKLPTGL